MKKFSKNTLYALLILLSSCGVDDALDSTINMQKTMDQVSEEMREMKSSMTQLPQMTLLMRQKSAESQRDHSFKNLLENPDKCSPYHAINYLTSFEYQFLDEQSATPEESEYLKKLAFYEFFNTLRDLKFNKNEKTFDCISLFIHSKKNEAGSSFLDLIEKAFSNSFLREQKTSHREEIFKYEPETYDLLVSRSEESSKHLLKILSLQLQEDETVPPENLKSDIEEPSDQLKVSLVQSSKELTSDVEKSFKKLKKERKELQSSKVRNNIKLQTQTRSLINSHLQSIQEKLLSLLDRPQDRSRSRSSLEVNKYVESLKKANRILKTIEQQ